MSTTVKANQKKFEKLAKKWERVGAVLTPATFAEMELQRMYWKVSEALFALQEHQEQRDRQFDDEFKWDGIAFFDRQIRKQIDEVLTEERGSIPADAHKLFEYLARYPSKA